MCGLYLRMAEAALNLRELTRDPDEAVVSPEMREAHNGNLAAVLFWCVLRLVLVGLSPTTPCTTPCVAPCVAPRMACIVWHHARHRALSPHPPSWPPSCVT